MSHALHLSQSRSSSWLLLLLSLCLAFSQCPAQRLVIPLTTNYGVNDASSYHNGTGRLKNYSAYALPDTTQFNRFAVRYLTFEVAQSLKEDVLKKLITSQSFAEYTTRYQIDTTHVMNQIIARNKVAILVGSDSQQKRFITVDANNNLNFRDDSTYVIDDTKPGKSYPVVRITFDYFDGTKLRTTQVPYTMDAYDVMEKELDVSFVKQSYKEGFMERDGSRYKLTLTNEFYDLYKNRRFKLNIKRIPLDSTVNNRYLFSWKELIDFNDRDLYQIDSLTRDSLYLSFHHRALYDGAKVSTKAPPIVAPDYIAGKQVSLYAYKGSYVVLDFWGSWCRPCIAALPNLVTLRTKYKQKGVKVVSVAYDSAADTAKLSKLIAQYKLDWHHILVERKGDRSVLINYKVQAFPSVLLIDPKGMVVVRGEGEKVLQEIDTYLATIFQ